jgi:hypothetical protein
LMPARARGVRKQVEGELGLADPKNMSGCTNLEE